MLGVAIEDEPLSRTRYDRRATPPAVAAFQATPQGAGDEQMKDLTLGPPLEVSSPGTENPMQR